MDLLLDMDEVLNPEKTNISMINHSLLRNTTRLLRLVEAFLLFFSLSWISAHLSPALRFSACFLSSLSSLLLNPASVFIIGNIIIIALVLNHGSSASETPNGEEADSVAAELSSPEEFQFFPSAYCHEEVVYEDKRTIFELKVVDEEENRKETWGGGEPSLLTDLSPPEAEKCMLTVFEAGSSPPEKRTCKNPDGLSSDEFRRTIEAFIAKQIKFQRDESLKQIPILSTRH